MFLLSALPMALVRKPPHAYMAMQLASTATVASVGATLHRRRLLVFSTSTGHHGEAAFVRSSRVAPLRRALLRRASTLIAQTEQGADELKSLVPDRSVTVLSTPVCLPDVTPPLTGAPSPRTRADSFRGRTSTPS